MAAAASEQSYRSGQPALIMDGDPTRYLFVVRTGAMDLMHGDEVVDVLEPGEPASAIPRCSRAWRPRSPSARGSDATCLLIPR